MEHHRLHYVYGPVYSWRLGVSLGVDPISQHEKICSMNCVYCQLGTTNVSSCERKVYVPTDAVIAEIDEAVRDRPVDYVTFSGRGEPTLALNLGEMIVRLKAREHGRVQRVAVITNSTLLFREDVRRDLMPADCVVAKLDACDAETCARIDAPVAGTGFDMIVQGIRDFRREFKGRLALQIMFVEANAGQAWRFAEMVRGLGADEIELNTPLRPSPVRALTEAEMRTVAAAFEGLPISMVYDRPRKTLEAWDRDETRRRHGQYDVEEGGAAR